MKIFPLLTWSVSASCLWCSFSQRESGTGAHGISFYYFLKLQVNFPLSPDKVYLKKQISKCYRGVCHQRDIKLRLLFYLIRYVTRRSLCHSNKTEPNSYTKILFSPITLAKMTQFESVFERVWGKQVSHTLVVPRVKSSLGSRFQNWKCTCPLTDSSTWEHWSCRSAFTSTTWHVSSVTHCSLDCKSKRLESQPKYTSSRGPLQLFQENELLDFWSRWSHRLDSFLTPYTKIKSKWIIVLNTGSKTSF